MRMNRGSALVIPLFQLHQPSWSSVDHLAVAFRLPQGHWFSAKVVHHQR
jgi:hypothetical protein